MHKFDINRTPKALSSGCINKIFAINAKGTKKKGFHNQMNQMLKTFETAEEQ
jgi:hypothetical protein